MNADEIYDDMKDAAEKYGWVGEHADELLLAAARSIAEDPQNES